MDFGFLTRDVPISVGIVIVLILSLGLIDRLMERRAAVTHFTRQLTMIVLGGIAAFITLIALPDSIVANSDAVRLVGVATGLLLTLSSTTLLANAMAGLMMRNVRSFKPGDFIAVDDYIGRVSQQGLFHVEIQTAQSDLVTLPNQFLITRPLEVIRSRGTFIIADVSLGYDTAHQVIEPLLVEAAERTSLTQPFVQVLTLGDYTVTYRVAGFLEDVTTLFTAQSSLRRRVLDTLHEAGVEIASPMLLGHRALPDGRSVVPQWDPAILNHRDDEESVAPADLIFDKAEEAAADSRAATEMGRLQAALKSLEQELKKADPGARDELEERQEGLTVEIARLEAEIEAHQIDGELDEEAERLGRTDDAGD